MATNDQGPDPPYLDDAKNNAGFASLLQNATPP